MSENGERIDPITAEHLIRGARANTHRRDPLAELLAAAAAPARTPEGSGEEAAVMAFRQARLAPAPESRRRSMLSTALTKLVTAKAALAVIAVGGGGVALAAGTGHLPTGTGPSHHHSTARSEVSASASHDKTSSAHPAAPAPTAARKTADPKGSPSPNLRGLCTAFNAGVGNNPGKALDNPAFTALINAAGGKDAVSGYCIKLLGAAKAKATDHSNSTHANGTPAHGTPSARPTGVPDPHASGPKHTPSHTAPVPPTTPAH